MPFDPIVLADDLCEVLAREGWQRQQGYLSRLAAGVPLDGVLAEVARRGLLDRLVPAEPSEEGAGLLGTLLAGCGKDGLLLVVLQIIERSGEYAAHILERTINRADQARVLSAYFQEIVRRGRYARLLRLLRENSVSEQALQKLARARPMYGMNELNSPAAAVARQGRPAGEFDVLIVPGYTPPGAGEPMHLTKVAAAKQRVEAAQADFVAGRAPFILVSGGAVHPDGTPHNEALMMREYLLSRGVPLDRVLVDPHARHSTTNLRNAGRMMHELGLTRALIVTGFDRAVFSQQFYFGHPVLSTFHQRCVQDLGYQVGDLQELDDHNHVVFQPSQEVLRPNYRDPLDV